MYIKPKFKPDFAATEKKKKSSLNLLILSVNYMDIHLSKEYTRH